MNTTATYYYLMSFSQPRLSEAIILICDDEKDIREILRDNFEDAGCQVIEASSGSQAWKLLQKHKVDCIISDISMADGDGTDFAKRVHESFSNIPFFLITGFSDYQGHEVRDYGVEAIFFKPFAVEEIVEAVALKLESL